MYLAAPHVLQRVAQQMPHRPVRKPVEGELPLAPMYHQIGLAEQAELMARHRLRRIGNGRQVAHAELATRVAGARLQGEQELEASGVREQREERHHVLDGLGTGERSPRRVDRVGVNGVDGTWLVTGIPDDPARALHRPGLRVGGGALNVCQTLHMSSVRVGRRAVKARRGTIWRRWTRRSRAFGELLFLANHGTVFT